MADPMNLTAVSKKKSRASRAWLLELLAIVLMLMVLTPFVVVLFNASKSYDQITMSPTAVPTDLNNLLINIDLVHNLFRVHTNGQTTIHLVLHIDLRSRIFTDQNHHQTRLMALCC